MFSSIIERCNKRLPPFISDKGASDKGFKDCLLWLSVLDFFKDNGENKVVFITMIKMLLEIMSNSSK